MHACKTTQHLRATASWHIYSHRARPVVPAGERCGIDGQERSGQRKLSVTQQRHHRASKGPGRSGQRKLSVASQQCLQSWMLPIGDPRCRASGIAMPRNCANLTVPATTAPPPPPPPPPPPLIPSPPPPLLPLPSPNPPPSPHPPHYHHPNPPPPHSHVSFTTSFSSSSYVLPPPPHVCPLHDDGDLMNDECDDDGNDGAVKVVVKQVARRQARAWARLQMAANTPTSSYVAWHR
eukprot:7011429-Pyramimonas_sp.AAC.1